MPSITNSHAKSIINLLTAHQPLTFNDFKQALALRPFELKKLLKSLENEKIIIKESGSGEEKYWLNESEALNFLGRDTTQRKRVRHPKKKKVVPETDDAIYG